MTIIILMLCIQDEICYYTIPECTNYGYYTVSTNCYNYVWGFHLPVIHFCFIVTVEDLILKDVC